MVLDRPGAEFNYNGKKYVIGESVVATEESEYDGLIGTILEIRDGDDKETENETPDIYCSFEPPVHPLDIRQLEQRFSALYQQPKTLEDIILDCVIMAPDMIEPLSFIQGNRHKLPLYTVYEEWVLDGVDGYSIAPFMDYRSARLKFCENLAEEQSNGCIHAWEERDDLVIETRKDYYECYLDGEYCQNHYKISIRQDTVLMSDESFGMIGRAYIDQSRMEDFASNAAEWDKAEALSDEQFQRFISDPSIPDRIEKKLGKNDPYWESYWDSISDVAHELLNEYLKNNTHPDCFTPEPDNPYPLCIGNGEEKCRQCCLYVDMEGEGGYDE